MAGGHITEDLSDEFYSGIVELETIKIDFVVAALKKMKVIAANITSAYIQPLTKELVFTIVNPKFGP